MFQNIGRKLFRHPREAGKVTEHDCAALAWRQVCAACLLRPCSTQRHQRSAAAACPLTTRRRAAIPSPLPARRRGSSEEPGLQGSARAEAPAPWQCGLRAHARVDHRSRVLRRSCRADFAAALQASKRVCHSFPALLGTAMPKNCVGSGRMTLSSFPAARTASAKMISRGLVSEPKTAPGLAFLNAASTRAARLQSSRARPKAFPGRGLCVGVEIVHGNARRDRREEPLDLRRGLLQVGQQKSKLSARASKPLLQP